MSGGGGGGDTTTVQKADPWSGQQPHLSYGFNEAQKLYESGGPQYYSGATYTPFSAQTETALQLAQNRALAGSPVNTAAQNAATSTLNGQFLPGTDGMYGALGDAMAGTGTAGNALSATARGDFLNANPYLDQTFDRAADAVTRNYSNTVMPGINSTFSAAGRTGSGLQQAAIGDATRNLGENLSGMATDIYGGNYAQERQNQLGAAGQLGTQQLAGANAMGSLYNNERGRQMQASALAPALANSDYNDFAQLANVGSTIEGKASEMLGDSMNRYNYYQGMPEQNLQRYIAAIQGNYGSATTQTTDGGNAGSSPLMGAVGGGMTGYALGGALGGATSGATYGPWGALIGAGLGYMMG